MGVELSGAPNLLNLEDSLTELALLAKTADVAVLGTITQRLNTPHSATFIGSGKVEELQAYALELGATVVIFDDELSPRQSLFGRAVTMPAGKRSDFARPSAP